MLANIKYFILAFQRY